MADGDARHGRDGEQDGEQSIAAVESLNDPGIEPGSALPYNACVRAFAVVRVCMSWVPGKWRSVSMTRHGTHLHHDMDARHGMARHGTA